MKQVLMLLLAASLAPSLPISAVDRAPLRAVLAAGDTVAITTLKQLPPDVAAVIHERFQAPGIADAGQPYNTGCLIVEGLSRNRFEWGRLAPDGAVFYYSTGQGFGGPRCSVLWIKRIPGAAASLAGEWSAPCNLRDAKALGLAEAGGQLSDSLPR